MAPQLSYPGVYVEELPSGVRTITGVPTSITAFIGRALRGPVDRPVTLTSFADFERAFGGLWAESHLGYSVRDFFQQGGGVALVVRVHASAGANDTATLTLGSGNKRLTLKAASPGIWGAKLKAIVDDKIRLNDDGTSDPTLFNLTVVDTATEAKEVFRNVSFAPGSARRADIVLAAESQFVRVESLPSAAQGAPSVEANATGGGDGGAIAAANISTGTDFRRDKKGLYALEHADLFNLLVIPPYLGTGDLGDRDVEAQVITDACAYARDRRAVVVLDPPQSWSTVSAAGTGASTFTSSKNAAVYFPRVRQPDPLREGQVMPFAPSGAIAGVIARTDAERGVWKAPAGLDATLPAVTELAVPLTDGEIGLLNPLAVNCLRLAPGSGHVTWGARTRNGSDRNASEWKYLPVRRTALFIEESLFRGIQWAVFEPNDEPLWAQLRLNIGAFLNNLFRQGAFQGKSPREAYFVKCDATTTTQNDINLGVVNILVGFAPLKPAEFVVLRLQQIAGQISA
ncbi:phage tail sheath family protein [Streptomyces tanashiensis]|jgi:phage tail sheath protein FI|uniref:Phage tail sheath subtilisin-like domain-containing protein n=1 Tax=Streptomyces tanashiensis TaxID=67367 RepID=A0ABY6R9X6_9ACTN|nr:phage tail sheath C-terminal domain-containing protein [Streptomyces tanashiensis]UZX25764.1 phage tail sheath subtilisin-like domain-containing protein [Streptomyces tanashiensis]GGY10246.1 tail protein [Streptomyces tanashiensis]